VVDTGGVQAAGKDTRVVPGAPPTASGAADDTGGVPVATPPAGRHAVFSAAAAADDTGVVSVASFGVSGLLPPCGITAENKSAQA